MPKTKLNFWFLLLLLAVLATGFFLSFQYFFLADFPIGRDVIAHIVRAQQIQKEGFLYAFKNSFYPFAYFIFIFVHKVFSYFGFSWQRTFIFLECFYLFVTAILSGVLAYKTFADWRVAALSFLLVSSSRWLNESLRIGLMGEMLGWVFLFLALIFLFEKRWLWFLGFSLVLFFSHFLPFAFLSLVFLGFAVFWSLVGAKKEAKRGVLIIFVVLVALALFYFLFPDIFQKIYAAFFEQSTREGERSLINYVIDSEKRRILSYTFSFVGFLILVVRLLKKRFFSVQSEKKWLFLIFGLFGFLLCFKHYLGIHFFSYRFYVYFEIFALILAAYGTVETAKMLSKRWVSLLLLPLAFILIYPNWKATKEITLWQLNTPELGDALPQNDRLAIDEIAAILEPNSKIYGPTSWHTWLSIYGFSCWGDWSGPEYAKIYSLSDFDKFKDYLLKKKYKYIYFSSVSPTASLEKADFLKLVYNKYGVRVYEVIFD